MTLYFLTGNQKKFLEVKEIFVNVEQKKIDLPEIQELDAQKIIEQKLFVAQGQLSEPFFCEDVSLEISCLNGFPGPLVKWFLQSLSCQQISKIVTRYSDHRAKAVCHIGYFDGETTHILRAEVSGTIVPPRGSQAFGFDSIFLPDGFEKTFAELSRKEKSQISHRALALQKLKALITS
ncbi:MAG: non-canonical purine NTP pyrophosphatase [Candidatus Woesearchaeota archaeon]